MPATPTAVSEVTVVTRRALAPPPARGFRAARGRLRDLRLTVPVLAAIVLSVAAMSAIVELSLRADASRQAQIKLDDVAIDVNQLQNMPWRLASSRSQTPAQIASAMAALESRTRSQLSALVRDTYVPELAPLNRLLRTNFVLLGDELAALGRHQVTQAQVFEPDRFHSQDLIVAALNSADGAYHDRAVRSEIEAAAGSGVIVLLLLGGFALFFARAFLAREAAERLAGQLAESQEHLEEAQRLAAIGSWEWDFDTQTYSCSPEQLRLHGWADEQELTNVEALLSAIDVADRERVRTRLMRQFEPGETVSLDYQVPDPEGKRLIHLEAKVVASRGGSPAGLIGTCQDVSDRFRRIEAERANLAKSEFISRMSHELRTPLNAILGFGQLLKVGGMDEQSRTRDVDRILGAGEHLLGLIDELLEISRIDANRPELCTDPSHLDGLISEAIDPVYPGPPDAEFSSDPSDSRATQTQLVLCIDDNTSNLTLVEHILSMRPAVGLLTAERGQQGLELASQRRPRLILLDVNLPDLDGGEVLTQLKADVRMREIPVVVLSADATPGQRERLIARGADAYLTKPIDVAELLALVDRILGSEPRELL
jgi:CheY-like chemotaxis protein/signal transduction histidine kinase